MMNKYYKEYLIKDYLEFGGLPRLTQETLHLYLKFLNVVRQLVIEYGWEEGLGSTMLNYHLKKLLGIRSNDLSKRHLILQTYAYLQDAHVEKFYHTSMNKVSFPQQR